MALLQCWHLISTRSEPLAMTRSELVARISSHFPQLTLQDAEASVSTILSAIAKTLTDGERVEIRGFGAFVVNYRPPRTGRNPATGASVQVSEKHVLRFKPGKDMRLRVEASAAGEEPNLAKSRAAGAHAQLRPPA